MMSSPLIITSCGSRLTLLTTVALLPNLSQGHTSLQPYEYNITVYTRTLPEELKSTVRTALRAERQAAQPNNRQQPCKPLEAVPCPPNKYRRPSGECNNVRHARWGNRGAAFLRLLPPAYADGKGQKSARVASGNASNFTSVVKVRYFLQSGPGWPSLTPSMMDWICCREEPASPVREHPRLTQPPRCGLHPPDRPLDPSRVCDRPLGGLGRAPLARLGQHREPPQPGLLQRRCQHPRRVLWESGPRAMSRLHEDAAGCRYG